MTRDTAAELKAINTILWKDWDPIGCGVPEDEYETYAWRVYRLLVDGARRNEIEDYLRVTADDTICMSVPKDKIVAVVDKLLALGIKTSASQE